MNKQHVITSSFAGPVYPEKPEDALRFFQTAWEQGPEPAEVSLPTPPVLIVPHIDFRVNLSCYVAAYKHLARWQTFPETFVILGVGHQCPYEIASLPLTYKTIFGEVETNLPAWDILQNNYSEPLALAEEAFENEHSLDFAIIWLQALQQIIKKPGKFDIVPILMGGLSDSILNKTIPGPESDFIQFCAAFKKMLAHLDPAKTCIIASIDGCHVGPRFDHPFQAAERVQMAVSAWEAELWSKCRSDQFDDFFHHLCSVANYFYFDGVGALSLLLQTFKMEAHREAYALWHEERDQSFVTFCGGFMRRL